MSNSIDTQLTTLQCYYDEQHAHAFFQLVDDVLQQLQHDKPLYVATMLLKASFYFRLHNHSLALQTLAAVSPFLEQGAMLDEQARYYNLLAAIHGENQNYDEALRCLQAALFSAENTQNEAMLIRIYYNLALYYFEQQQFHDSLLYVQKSRAYLKRAHYDIPPVTPYTLELTYARILIALHELDSARTLIHNVQTNDEALRHTSCHAELAITTSELLVAEQKMDDAYEQLHAVLPLCTHEPHIMLRVYEPLCRVAKQLSNKRIYFHHLKEFYELKTAVFTAQQDEQLQAIDDYFDERPYKEASWTDALTSIHNRRYLEENYAPKNETYAVLVFDIDRFKSINDTYGHLVGDEAIKAMAQTTASFFQPHNALVVRLGGDEFVVAFSVRSVSYLQQLLDTFLTKIRTLTIKGEQHTFQLTTSVGACFSTSPLDLTTALELADRALYDAKRGGRDQFAIYEHSEQNK